MKPRWIVGIGVAVGLAILGVANAHLVIVAMSSQPECVTHSKSLDQDDATFRAAKSSC